MVTQQSALNIARQFVAEIIAQGLPLQKALLFGSYSKGQQHELSDIDVALVSDAFMRVGFFDIKQLAEVKISNNLYATIETHTFNPKDFTPDNPFVKEIEQTGLSLL